MKIRGIKIWEYLSCSAADVGYSYLLPNWATDFHSKKSRSVFESFVTPQLKHANWSDDRRTDRGRRSYRGPMIIVLNISILCVQLQLTPPVRIGKRFNLKFAGTSRLVATSQVRLTPTASIRITAIIPSISHHKMATRVPSSFWLMPVPR